MKFEFRFPDIGEGITEGTLMKWLVKEGGKYRRRAICGRSRDR